MILKEISGQRQLDFMKDFDYIREAGTDAELKAAHSIQEHLKNMGVDSHLEEFEFKTWKVLEATFTVTEPFEKTYRVVGYGRGGETPEEGIEAPFLYAENLDDMNFKKAKGKIILVNFQVEPDNYSRLIESGAVAFLTIAGTPLDQGIDLIPEEKNIPLLPNRPLQGAIIHYKDAIELVERGASRARFTLKHEYGTAPSYNVIARIEGSDLADEVITLSAHYDSVPNGKGAYDNMAGAAIIMELCHYFKEHQPRRTLEFIWFGAEEKGLCGSRNYVEVHSDDLKNHIMNLNVDLAGQLVGGNIICVTGDSSICPFIEESVNATDIAARVCNAVWSSDSNTFAWKGVPALTLNRNGFGMHTRYDIVDFISPWSLQRSAYLLCDITEKMANLTTLPFKREVPEQLQNELNFFYKRYDFM